MRILILDDDEIRHKHFAKHYADHYVKHVYSHTAAVVALMNDERYDLVHLDHDLNDFVDYDPAFPGQGHIEFTGMDTAVFITNRLGYDNQPSKIIIHSWNPAGAQRMLQHLQHEGIQESVYEPFTPDPMTLSELAAEDMKGNKR